MLFFQEILREPRKTGALAPSSRGLAEMVTAAANVPTARTIVELGAGTGAVTRTLIAAMRPDAKLYAMERNGLFARQLRAKFASISVVEDCATRLSARAVADGFSGADSIVSGLPWSMFEPSVRSVILDNVHAILSDDGIFATYTYFGPHLLPAGRQFQGLLKTKFSDVRSSRVVLQNFPPAFVLSCRK